MMSVQFKGTCKVFLSTHCGQIMWCLSLLILHVDVSPVKDEERAELSPPLLSGLVQWSEVPSIRGIDWTVVLDQPGSHVNMLEAKGAGDDCHMCHMMVI